MVRNGWFHDGKNDGWFMMAVYDDSWCLKMANCAHWWWFIIIDGWLAGGFNLWETVAFTSPMQVNWIYPATVWFIWVFPTMYCIQVVFLHDQSLSVVVWYHHYSTIHHWSWSTINSHIMRNVIIQDVVCSSAMINHHSPLWTMNVTTITCYHSSHDFS